MPKRQPEVGDIWKSPHDYSAVFLITRKFFSEEKNTHMLSLKNLNSGFDTEMHFVYIRDCWEYVS